MVMTSITSHCLHLHECLGLGARVLRWCQQLEIGTGAYGPNRSNGAHGMYANTMSNQDASVLLDVVMASNGVRLVLYRLRQTTQIEPKFDLRLV